MSHPHCALSHATCTAPCRMPPLPPLHATAIGLTTGHFLLCATAATATLYIWHYAIVTMMPPHNAHPLPSPHLCPSRTLNHLPGHPLHSPTCCLPNMMCVLPTQCMCLPPHVLPSMLTSYLPHKPPPHTHALRPPQCTPYVGTNSIREGETLQFQCTICTYLDKLDLLVRAFVPGQSCWLEVHCETQSSPSSFHCSILDSACCVASSSELECPMRSLFSHRVDNLSIGFDFTTLMMTGSQHNCDAHQVPFFPHCTMCHLLDCQKYQGGSWRKTQTSTCEEVHTAMHLRQCRLAVMRQLSSCSWRITRTSMCREECMAMCFRWR